MTQADQPQWIALDCAATQARAWALGPDGVLARTVSSQPAPVTEPASPHHAASDGRQAMLRPDCAALISRWIRPGCRIPVIASGPACAPGPAPRPVPCPPLGVPVGPIPTGEAGIALHLIAGLSQQRPFAGIMEGGETRIAGVLASRPGWDGVICLPGLESFWVELSAGEVISFHSAPGGTLLAALAPHVLPADGAPDMVEQDDVAVTETVAEMLARPQAFPAILSQIRAKMRLGVITPAVATGMLAGLVVGIELASARPWWLGREVVVVEGDGLAAQLPYARALRALTVQAATIPDETATLAGFVRAYSALPKG